MYFNIIFSGLISILLYLPSPVDWKLQSSFSVVFNNITYNSIMHAIAAPLSYFINAYLISKWKIMLNGRYFGLRSILASLIGEFIFSVMMVAFIWHKNNYISSMLSLMFATYFTKFIWAILGAYPASIIVYYLKKSEGVDIYDNYINFNPFSASAKLEPNP